MKFLTPSDARMISKMIDKFDIAGAAADVARLLNSSNATAVEYVRILSQRGLSLPEVVAWAETRTWSPKAVSELMAMGITVTEAGKYIERGVTFGEAYCRASSTPF